MKAEIKTIIIEQKQSGTGTHSLASEHFDRSVQIKTIIIEQKQFGTGTIHFEHFDQDVRRLNCY